MKHIKFVYTETGEIDWDKTIIPVIDFSKVKLKVVEPTPEDKKRAEEIYSKERVK